MTGAETNSKLHGTLWSKLAFYHPDEDLGGKVDDLHGADEGEAGEEPHGPSHGGEPVHKLGSLVLP